MRPGDTRISSKKLFDYRKSHHWTQEELSEASGLSLRTIQRAEKAGLVSNSTLKSLAAVFSINASDLIETTPESPAPPARRKWIQGAAVLIVLAVIGGVVAYMVDTDGPVHGKESVAVIPFVSTSDDPTTFSLAGSLTEEVALRLSRSQKAAIVPLRNSRSAMLAQPSIAEIGNALSATLIVEGAIQREGDDRYRVLVQLIDTKSEAHVWSDSYSRDTDEVLSITPSMVESIEAQYRR